MTTRTITVEDVKRAIRIVADAEQYDLGYVKEVKRLADDVADNLAALPAEPAGATGLRDFVEWHAQLQTDPPDNPSDDGYRFISETDLRILADFVAALAATTPVGEGEG